MAEAMFMDDDVNLPDPYLPPGTPVRYDGLLHELGSPEEGPEYGVVVHCWFSDELQAFDCYIAFFGNQRPTGVPSKKPYIMRYASRHLVVLDPDQPT